MCVRGETDSLALGAFVPKTEELNLSNNLLASWHAVGDIIRHLSNIECLHLR